MKFIKSVIDEMKRVTWPTKQQLRKDTIVVIETSIIFTVMFFVMDTVIQNLLALIFILCNTVFMFFSKLKYSRVRNQ